jgi:hypothetical protein
MEILPKGTMARPGPSRPEKFQLRQKKNHAARRSDRDVSRDAGDYRGNYLRLAPCVAEVPQHPRATPSKTRCASPRAHRCSSSKSDNFDLRTTPWMACDPKWPLAGDPNTRVTLENGTSDPPLTQTCSMDSTVSFFEKGAGPPLPVIYAGPVTMNPGLVVTGGA